MKQTLAVILFFSFVIVSTVSAVDLSIEKNGSGSENSITVEQKNTNVNVQENSLTITNNVNANASTGNNTANGNSGNTTIVTGNASTTVNVNNTGNTNINDPKVTPKKSPTIAPTPTTKPNSNNGGSNNNSSSSNNNNGSNSGNNNNQSNGTGGDEPKGEILGLAATDSDTTIPLTTAAGTLCLALAGFILKQKRI